MTSYVFKCKCGNREEIKYNPNEISALEIICDKCGEKMHRDWKSINLNYPSDLNEICEINSRMKHSTPIYNKKTVF